jgi:hypothetical protein
MGTRADFYIGRGKQAEWLGSIAWDGYPDGIEPELLAATTDADFRTRLAAFFQGRKDATLPADGWPWPWNDSNTTDYAYAFDGGKVYGSCFGKPWFDPLVVIDSDEEEDEEQPTFGETDFPDMSAVKNMTLGPRSGVIVITG